MDPERRRSPCRWRLRAMLPTAPGCCRSGSAVVKQGAALGPAGSVRFLHLRLVVVSRSQWARIGPEWLVPPVIDPFTNWLNVRGVNGHHKRCSFNRGVAQLPALGLGLSASPSWGRQGYDWVLSRSPEHHQIMPASTPQPCTWVHQKGCDLEGVEGTTPHTSLTQLTSNHV